MKKSIITAFVLGLMFTSTNLFAQDCPEGDQDAKRTYSLYKEYYKQGAFDRALPYWRDVYENAPGLTKGIFIDGADMFIDLIEKTEDEAQKSKYVDTLLNIYDNRIQCWGDKGYVLQLKGMDIIRYRPEEYPEAKLILEEAINLDQADSKYYGVQSYFNLLIHLKDEVEGVDEEFIKGEYDKLIAICDANIERDNNAKQFAEVKAAMSYNLKEHVLPKRFDQGQPWHTWTAEAKSDSIKQWITEDSSLVNLEDILSNIRRDADIKDSEVRYNIEKILFENNPTANAANNLGVYYYEQEKGEEAIHYFKKAIELTEDDDEGKANFLLAIGDTYRKMDKFPEAREAARSAMELDTTSAKPYYLIGLLYLSSGSKCGPGTGFNSQRVIWPAFDYFNKAKELDESYAEIVDPLMKDYKKYLPTRAEIAERGLRVGNTYTVPCWINEETTIRAKH